MVAVVGRVLRQDNVVIWIEALVLCIVTRAGVLPFQFSGRALGDRFLVVGGL